MWSKVLDSIPSIAWNEVPGHGSTVTGAPANAAYFCGSRYISKSWSGLVGKDAARITLLGMRMYLTK